MAWDMTDEERKAADPRNKMLKGGVDPRNKILKGGVDPRNETWQGTDPRNKILKGGADPRNDMMGSGKAFQAGPNPEAGSIFNAGPKQGVKSSTLSMNNQVTQPNISKIPDGKDTATTGLALGESGLSPTIKDSKGKLINPTFAAGLTEPPGTAPSSVGTPNQAGLQTVAGPPSGSGVVTWRGPQGESRFETVDDKGNITRGPGVKTGGEGGNWQAGTAFNPPEKKAKPTWTDEGKNEFGKMRLGNPTGGWSGPPQTPAQFLRDQMEPLNEQMSKIQEEITGTSKGEVYKGGVEKYQGHTQMFNELMKQKNGIAERVAAMEQGEGVMKAEEAEKLASAQERMDKGEYYRGVGADYKRAQAEALRKGKAGASENSYNKILKDEQSRAGKDMSPEGMKKYKAMSPLDWDRHIAKRYPKLFKFDEENMQIIDRRTGEPIVSSGGQDEQLPDESRKDVEPVME